MDGKLTITFEDAWEVSASWDKLKTIKDYQARMGRPLFSKFIEIEPEVKGPLQIDQKDIDNETPHYKHLYKVYFDMLEQCIPQLGPELLDELEDLGYRHGTFGVKPPFFVTLGEATFYALEDIMGDTMTESEMAAWRNVYKFLADNMIAGCKKFCPKVATPTTNKQDIKPCNCVEV